MYQQERMDAIMRILNENNYVTVDYLVSEIRYSPASIRRDLTLLEKQGLVVRSYGGVSLNNANTSPFRFRQHSMKLAKNAMARKAAELVRENDVVYIAGTSTTQYIGLYLTEKKGITVITSNMLLAGFLSERGVTTFCTGGKVVDQPGILGGQFVLDTIRKFNIDIAFVSSLGFHLDGKILSVNEQGQQKFAAYRECAEKLVYLCGSDKFDTAGKFVCGTLDEIDYFISDKDVPEALKERYSSTVFISAEQ